MIYKFQNLDVWKAAKELAGNVYGLTRQYPNGERFALTDQTNRAVVSISANIAEGTSRESVKDFNHFLDIALGSAFELVSLLEIAFDLKYIPKRELDEILVQVERVIMLLYGLKRSLRKRNE